MIPSEYTSDAALISRIRPAACSGDKYRIVPITVPPAVRSSARGE